MSRPNHWPELLADFIEERRGLPFSFTENNCGLFAADWLLALLGVDVAADWRGLPSSFEVVRKIKAAGGADTAFAVAASGNGWEEVAPSLAQRGDIMSTQTKHGAALGVCIGKAAAFMQKNGPGFVPLATCSRAWRIN